MGPKVSQEQCESGDVLQADGLNPDVLGTDCVDWFLNDKLRLWASPMVLQP